MGIKESKSKYIFASPLRYPGGKTRLALKLDEAIKKNFRPNDKITLVEPYAGGAGASLKLLLSESVNKVIINDLDNSIYTFWKIAVLDSDYLIRKIKQIDVSISEWKKQKLIYHTSRNEHKLAFATLFLNRTNRSGIMNGRPIGGLQQLSKWKIDERFTKKTIIERLQKIKKFCSKIKVYNLDGIELLKKLEKQKKSDQYFIFIDPPYYKKGQSLYLNNYKNNNHEDLSKFLIKSSLKKWTMTYNNTPYIKNLYKEMKIKEFAIHHNAHYSKVGKEIMIFPKNFMPIDI